MSKRFNVFGNLLGEFVEEMVKPALIKLFKGERLEVHELCEHVRFKRAEDGAEVDMIMIYQKEAVSVEWKSRVTVEDDERHLECTQKVKLLDSMVADRILYGTIADRVVDENAAKLALQNGLYLLHLLQQSEKAVEIANPRDFIPRKF
ncbi:MAG: hypothetical protein N2035_05790 [Chthoniobacterales bacterium]|nr:hypothetical protein [Chthoniobacterales bacterium]